jgi:hypothetical protein
VVIPWPVRRGGEAVVFTTARARFRTFRGISSDRLETRTALESRGFSPFPGACGKRGYRLSSPLKREAGLKSPQKCPLSSRFRKRNGVKGGSKSAWKRAVTQRLTQHRGPLPLPAAPGRLLRRLFGRPLASRPAGGYAETAGSLRKRSLAVCSAGIDSPGSPNDADAGDGVL